MSTPFAARMGISYVQVPMHPLNSLRDVGVEEGERDLDIDKVISDLDNGPRRGTHVRQYVRFAEKEVAGRTKVHSGHDLAASMTQSPS